MTINIPRITHFPSFMFAVIDLGHKVLRVEEIQVRLLQTSDLTRSGHLTHPTRIGSLSGCKIFITALGLRMGSSFSHCTGRQYR